MGLSLRDRMVGTPHRETADIAVRGFEPFPVRLLGAEDGTYSLGLGRSTPEVRLLHREKALLQLPNGTNREGMLMAIEGKHRRMLSDRIQFLVDGLPTGSQKRQFTRVPVVIPVLVGINPARGDWREGWTVDLSTGGALIGGVTTGRTGHTLRVQFRLPGNDDRIVAAGSTTRVTEAGLRALRWTAIDAADRRAITEYLESEHRRLLERRYGS